MLFLFKNICILIIVIFWCYILLLYYGVTLFPLFCLWVSLKITLNLSLPRPGSWSVQLAIFGWNFSSLDDHAQWKSISSIWKSGFSWKCVIVFLVINNDDHLVPGPSHPVEQSPLLFAIFEIHLAQGDLMLTIVKIEIKMSRWLLWSRYWLLRSKWLSWLWNPIWQIHFV